ncbi:hypothetical protein HN011_000501 [Eciton burchellii]|nr:hypothetical protein HN011_000501 [Eciton burchellii]
MTPRTTLATSRAGFAIEPRSGKLRLIWSNTRVARIPRGERQKIFTRVARQTRTRDTILGEHPRETSDVGRRWTEEDDARSREKEGERGREKSRKRRFSAWRTLGVRVARVRTRLGAFSLGPSLRPSSSLSDGSSPRGPVRKEKYALQVRANLGSKEQVVARPRELDPPKESARKRSPAMRRRIHASPPRAFHRFAVVRLRDEVRGRSQPSKVTVVTGFSPENLPSRDYVSGSMSISARANEQTSIRAPYELRRNDVKG